ncbi:hypothetical protein [Bradyrhizobium hereditatis]|uniref:hypothetical protein n=1 Tax=Bradyrhizobium hereditatis TaxID=2821405 RepID=UPI0035DA6371
MRTRKIAVRDLFRVAHIMKLEAQATSDANLEARIEAYIRDQIKERGLCNEPGTISSKSPTATPRGPGERDALLQTWITDRDDLNEVEQENIVRGAAWAGRRRGNPPIC